MLSCPRLVTRKRAGKGLAGQDAIAVEEKEAEKFLHANADKAGHRLTIDIGGKAPNEVTRKERHGV
jgi:hypothetical protein